MVYESLLLLVMPLPPDVLLSPPMTHSLRDNGMMQNRYVALLRGVNIGGRRPVPRAEFAQVLTDLGARDVSVYINSGNAVFTHDDAPSSAEVQQALETFFPFDVQTLVLSGSQVLTIAQAIPEHWRNDPVNPQKAGHKSDVLYLFPEADDPDILTRIGHQPEHEEMQYLPGAVITRVSRANQSRSSLQRLAALPLYAQVTVRNVNTARALGALL